MEPASAADTDTENMENDNKTSRDKDVESNASLFEETLYLDTYASQWSSKKDLSAVLNVDEAATESWI